MIIETLPNIYAYFFMRDEATDEIDSMPRVSPSQIHGDNVVHVHDDNAMVLTLPERPKADGVFLTTTKVSASMRFADCAPVMLWGEQWVMILHSGFKGTVLNIACKGLELVRNFYGDDEVNESRAWIGPCIGHNDYERDVNEEWSVMGMREFHRENYDLRDEKVYFDLAGEIESQLLECGLSEKNITLSGINTFRDSRCYSYRRGDIHDRMTLHVKLLNQRQAIVS